MIPKVPASLKGGWDGWKLTQVILEAYMRQESSPE